METVSIRNIRGARLRDSARAGDPLAITNSGALIGVLIPVSTAWVEHLVDHNWSQVRRSIAEGEQAIAAGTPVSSLTAFGTAPGGSEPESGAAAPARPAIPLLATMAGRTVALAPHSRAVLQQLQAALTAPAEPQPGAPVVAAVRIGDLSAERIAQAAASGETLALTHDRELIGVLIPVTQSLVQFLIEQSLSRVMYNVSEAEIQLASAERLPTLTEWRGSDTAGEKAAQESRGRR